MAASSEFWNASLAMNALESHEFEDVVAHVCTAIDSHRDPRAVNWSVEYGYRRGHVPILFFLAKNMLRYGRGRVPSCEDLSFGLKCAVLLLLRTAQDVASSKLDMAKADRNFVYTTILTHVRYWVLRWNKLCLPSIADIADGVSSWVQAERTELPLPVWVTCFSTSRYFGTVSWSRPEVHDVASFKRSETVKSTRTNVADKFLSALRASTHFEAFFNYDIDAFMDFCMPGCAAKAE